LADTKNILEKNKIINDQIEDQLINIKRENADKIRMNFFYESDCRSKIKNVNRQVEEIMNQRNRQLFERRKR
jgi:hypothetical protein